MKEYTIIFNGKEEKWIRSDEEMTFDDAQKWIKKNRGTPATVSELWAIDSETQKPRWFLLKEAGARGWCWSDEDFERARFAYGVGLSSGSVYANSRNYYIYYALCRVGF